MIEKAGVTQAVNEGMQKMYKGITDFFHRNKRLAKGSGLKRSDTEEPEIPPFTRWVTFGVHMYRQADERCDVEFVDKDSGIRKMIINNAGQIMGFPGVEKGAWTRLLDSEESLQPIVMFRTEFSRYSDTHYIMVWEVQPDGRYWEDSDGFGASNDVEIRLYALIDQKGCFDGPFRIYSIGKEIKV